MKNYRSNLHDICCQTTDTIMTVIKKMTEKHNPFCCVLQNQTFVGFVNDADIRGAIIRGISLESSIQDIMKKNPVTAPYGIDDHELKMLFEKARKDFIPIVKSDGTLYDVINCHKYFYTRKIHPNKVFLMIGGEGRRLLPLTDSLPKPMVNYFGKPILETILENFVGAGFEHFVFCVNYLSEHITRHFGSGEKWNAHIEYLHESKKLGTAGALALYDKEINEPIIVMNGDLITGLSFGSLVDFHAEEQARMTMCVYEFEYQVPYGVVTIDGNRFTGLQEKPMYTFFINAGIYVLNPELLSLLPKNTYCDMTDLVNAAHAHYPNAVSCFPILEYWRDIGTVNDLHLAHKENGKKKGRSLQGKE